VVVENDLNLKLLAGMSINISNLGIISPLKLREIINLGESNYNELLSVLLIDKSNIEGLKDQEFSNLELLMVFCHQSNEFRDKTLKALKLFLNNEFFVSNEGLFYCRDLISDNYGLMVYKYIIIDKIPFNDFQMVLKKANHIETKKEDEIIPGNERARKFMEKLKLSKQNIKKPETMNLHSIISGIAWKSNNTNIINIFDLTIYQLYDAYHRLENIDNYHYTLSGLYAGTVDGKNINLSNITWTKIIKN